MQAVGPEASGWAKLDPRPARLRCLPCLPRWPQWLGMKSHWTLLGCVCPSAQAEGAIAGSLARAQLALGEPCP